MLGSYHKRLCDSVMKDDGVIKVVLFTIFSNRIFYLIFDNFI